MSDEPETLARRICRLIEEHLEEPLPLATLAESVGLSAGHLQRVFKREVGISPRQYQAARRLARFKERLREGSTVTHAVYEAGYGSPSRVYEQASEQLGMTPAAYRTGGKAQTIRYTFISCRLGQLLLAGTARGVCAVYLGDDHAVLERELRREFPAARLGRDDPGLAIWSEQVRRQVDGEQPAGDLPLDVQATAFQWRVWQHLRTIPAGEVRTYLQVAIALGKPTAARAVARACATNPVSIVIPCHRVVRGDGGLGGYRWGLERKRKLLDQEQGKPGTEPGE